MSDLTELQKRVKAATGADRELDAAVFNALVDDGGRVAFKVANWSTQPGGRLSRYHDGWLFGRSETDEYADDLPRYTGSIDAALGLVEKRLPGWSWRIGNTLSRPNDPFNTGAFCRLGTTPGEIEGATPPLAILTALLSAIRKPKEDEG